MSQKREIGVGGLVITPEDKRLVNKVLDSNRLSYAVTTELSKSSIYTGCHQYIFFQSSKMYL